MLLRTSSVFDTPELFVVSIVGSLAEGHVCVLQSEPFNGQGSLPAGAAGGYNAFTQAAVNGVSHGRTQSLNNH